jgi:hypothetical protein
MRYSITRSRDERPRSRGTNDSRPQPLNIPRQGSSVRFLVDFFNKQAFQPTPLPIKNRKIDPVPHNKVKSLVVNFNRLHFFSAPTTVVSSSTYIPEPKPRRHTIPESSRVVVKGVEAQQFGKPLNVKLAPKIQEDVEEITVSGGDKRETTYKKSQEPFRSVKIWKEHPGENVQSVHQPRQDDGRRIVSQQAPKTMDLPGTFPKAEQVIADIPPPRRKKKKRHSRSSDQSEKHVQQQTTRPSLDISKKHREKVFNDSISNEQPNHYRESRKTKPPSQETSESQKPSHPHQGRDLDSQERASRIKIGSLATHKSESKSQPLDTTSRNFRPAAIRDTAQKSSLVSAHSKPSNGSGQIRGAFKETVSFHKNTKYTEKDKKNPSTAVQDGEPSSATTLEYRRDNRGMVRDRMHFYNKNNLGSPVDQLQEPVRNRDSHRVNALGNSPISKEYQKPSRGSPIHKEHQKPPNVQPKTFKDIAILRREQRQKAEPVFFTNSDREHLRVSPLRVVKSQDTASMLNASRSAMPETRSILSDISRETVVILDQLQNVGYPNDSPTAGPQDPRTQYQGDGMASAPAIISIKRTNSPPIRSPTLLREMGFPRLSVRQSTKKSSSATKTTNRRPSAAEKHFSPRMKLKGDLDWKGSIMKTRNLRTDGLGDVATPIEVARRRRRLPPSAPSSSSHDTTASSEIAARQMSIRSSAGPMESQLDTGPSSGEGVKKEVRQAKRQVIPAKRYRPKVYFASVTHNFPVSGSTSVGSESSISERTIAVDGPAGSTVAKNRPRSGVKISDVKSQIQWFEGQKRKGSLKMKKLYRVRPKF